VGFSYSIGLQLTYGLQPSLLEILKYLIVRMDMHIVLVFAVVSLFPQSMLSSITQPKKVMQMTDYTMSVS
jgi:hypothetical protein